MLKDKRKKSGAWNLPRQLTVEGLVHGPGFTHKIKPVSLTDAIRELKGLREKIEGQKWMKKSRR